MEKTLTIILLFLITQTGWSQRYLTQNGYVRFFSEAPLEDIEAVNTSASCIVDVKTGEVVAKVRLKAFEFDKALMEEHFNENYVESHKYPEALLKAKIKTSKELDFDSSDPQEVILEGTMNLHNVSRQLTIPGTFRKAGENYIAEAVFIMKPADYNIKIPRIVRNNIAKEIEVSVKLELKPLQ